MKIGYGLGIKVAKLAGVDMGNGLSPLLFMLALDPLLWALVRVDGVHVVQAYMMT